MKIGEKESSSRSDTDGTRDMTISDDSFSLTGDEGDVDEVEDMGIFNDTTFWGDAAAGNASAHPDVQPDNFLSCLLLEQTTKGDMQRKISSTVKQMSRMSFRKRSASSLITSRRASDDEGGAAHNEASSIDLAMVESIVGQSRVFGPSVAGLSRTRRKILQLMDSWSQSASASECTSRVKQLKELLTANPQIATEFLSAASDTPQTPSLLEGDDAVGTPAHKKGLAVVGAAFRMLDTVRQLKHDDVLADAKTSQAFEVMYAAVNVASEWAEPLPQVVPDLLDEVLCSEWRPVLASFFALRLIIALNPRLSLRYCREVLSKCMHFQFRVLDTAMVCVAEEAIEGTLPDPASWISPVIQVVHLLTSATMSQDLLVLALDVLSYTFSCGCASGFVNSNGIAALTEALLALDCTVENVPVLRRVLRLINPSVLTLVADDASPNATSPLAPMSGDAIKSFEASLHNASRKGSDGALRTFVAFGDGEGDNDGPLGRFTAASSPKKSAQLTKEHFKQVLSAALTVVDRFGSSEAPPKHSGTPPESHLVPAQPVPVPDYGAVVEESCLVLFSVVQMCLPVCTEVGAVESLCRSLATSAAYCSNATAIRAALSVIKTYLSAHHAAGAADAQASSDIFSDHGSGAEKTAVNAGLVSRGTTPQYKIATLSTVSSSNSPNFYRPIMESGILAVMSLSVRLFFAEEVLPNSMIANVYRVIHTVCLTEPAKSCFHRGCMDSLQDDEADQDNSETSGSFEALSSRLPEPNALVPCLIACLSRTSLVEHQRYCTIILHRLCRGSPLEFCSQLLGPLPPGTLATPALASSGKRGAAAPPSTADTPVGIICRFYAKRLGTWPPQLIPHMLNLCGELARFLRDETTVAFFHRGALESLMGALQSVVTSFSADPNIVASACVILGHLCRCPHTSSQSSQSSYNLLAFRPLNGFEENTDRQERRSSLSAHLPRSRANSAATSTGIGSTLPPMLRYAVSHNVLDLVVGLVHATFAVSREKSTPAKSPVGGRKMKIVTISEEPAEASQLPSNDGDDGSQDRALERTTGPVGHHPLSNLEASASPESIVLSQKLPAVVKYALAYVAAALSVDKRCVRTLGDEGLVALMQSLVDMHHRNRGPSTSSDAGAEDPPSPRHDKSGAHHSPGRSQSAVNLLLNREEKDFIRERLTHILEAQHIEDDQVSSIGAGSVLFHAEKLPKKRISAAGVETPEYAVSFSREQHDVHCAEEHFKARIRLIEECEHRRRSESDEESAARDHIRTMFRSRQTEILQKQERHVQRHQQDRLDFLLRAMEARQQIEQFQQETFFEIVAYSHRSFQKRLTAATVRAQGLASSLSPGSLSLTNAMTSPTRAGSSPSAHPPPREDERASTLMVTVDDLHGSSSHSRTLARTEKDAALQLEQLKLELGLQTSASLATMMQSISATYAAVKHLQQEQQLLVRELASPRPAPPRVSSSRPMSAPHHRQVESFTQAIADQHAPAHHDTGDGYIFEDRASTPLRGSHHRVAYAATPPPQASRHTASPSSYRLLVQRHPSSTSTRRPTTPEHPITLAPEGHLSEVSAQLEAVKARIVVLDLNRAYLGDAGLLAILPILSQALCLRELRLQRNGLSAHSVVPLLAETLTQLPCFELLDLSYNRDLTPRVGRDLIQFVKAHSQVRRIITEGCQIFNSTQRILDTLVSQRGAMLVE